MSARELRAEPYPTFRGRAPRHGCQPCLRGGRPSSRVSSQLSLSASHLGGTCWWSLDCQTLLSGCQIRAVRLSEKCCQRCQAVGHCQALSRGVCCQAVTCQTRAQAGERVVTHRSTSELLVQQPSEMELAIVPLQVHERSNHHALSEEFKTPRPLPALEPLLRVHSDPVRRVHGLDVPLRHLINN